MSRMVASVRTPTKRRESIVDEFFRVTADYGQNTGDHYNFQPLLRVTRDRDEVGTILMRMTGTAIAVLRHRFEGQVLDAQVQDRMLRWGLGRLVGRLSHPGGAHELFAESSLVAWTILEIDLDNTILDDSVFAKRCSYQKVEGRDLYCAAAGQGDGIGTSGIRQIAITSRPMCDGCQLPDDRLLCSSLTHPNVLGQSFSSGAREASP